MTIPAEQQTDLNKVNAEVAKLKINAFTMLLYLVRDDVKLEHAGYKSLEDATRKIITTTTKATEKLIIAYENKWPD